MNSTPDPSFSIPTLITLLRTYPKRWIVPTVVCAVLGLVAALIYQPNWAAYQTLTVRPSTSTGEYNPGMASDTEQLKQTQETVLELARSPAVVAAALQSVQPAGRRRQTIDPSDPLVDTVRGRIKMVPPNGAEFGTTELFYLVVSDPNRERAVALTKSICDRLEGQFRVVRNQKTRSLIDELTHAESVAQQELDATTRQVADLESEVGPDLAELRLLSESNAGESNLQATLVAIQQEVRQAETARQTGQLLLELLHSAQQEPSHLVATPNQLLESQPALRRLKDGLIDAQLTTSRLLGTMSPSHPRVLAARVAEEEIRGHLHRELDLAIKGVQVELQLSQKQIDTLTVQVTDLRRRLQRLAAMRAQYSTLVAEAGKRTEALTEIQRSLTAARTRLESVGTSSPITRVGVPQTGPYPAGPGRRVIAGAGLVGGLLFGLGLLVLTAPQTTASQNEPLTPIAAAAPAPAPPAPQRPPNPVGSDKPRPITRRRKVERKSRPDGRSMSLTEALAQCADDESWL